MERIILIGLNHKTAPVEVRECLAFSEAESSSALAYLQTRPCIDEAIIFSTCNRVELLLKANHAREAVAAAKQFFVDTKQVPLGRFESSLYLHQGEAAVRHIFRVAASLDSMVVGEPQILGQVKSAYRHAADAKACGVILNRLLHRTFSVAKRIRSETGIGDHAVSISYAAIELGRKIFGTLERLPVLLIGAGEMAELAVEHLLRHRVGRIFVANRTFERGLELAERYHGTAIRFEEIKSHLSQVDIIISSVAAPTFVVQRTDVKAVMRSRRNRPLFFIDIAVPRNIDPGVNDLNNCFVYDIDDLNEVIDDNIEDRRREAIKAERIIDEAVIQFRRWFVGLDVVPIIRRLREKVTTVAYYEMHKTLSGRQDLPPETQKAIARMVDTTINKILHDPINYLKNNGGHSTEWPRTLDLVHKIFGLDNGPPGNEPDDMRNDS